MKHATSAALYEHWRSLRGAARWVARSSIQPRDFGALLPDLFLIETELSEGAPFRYCGAALTRRYGRDLEGEGFLSLWRKEDRITLQRHLSAMGRSHGGVVIGVIAETAGAGCTSFEMPLLPLKGDRGIDSAIGCMVRIGGHEDSNRIRARVLSQEIRSLRVLGDDVVHVFAPALGSRSAEPDEGAQASFPRPRSSRSPFQAQSPHLTLVQGGK